MPHFHFDVHAANDIPDIEGINLRDLDAAKAAAIRSARFLVLEEMRVDNRFSPNHSIRIRDAAGNPLHTTRYGDCIDIRS